MHCLETITRNNDRAYEKSRPGTKVLEAAFNIIEERNDYLQWMKATRFDQENEKWANEKK